MSRENVAMVQRRYEAFNRRDIDAVVAEMHPEVELRTTVETHHGHAGVAEWITHADAVFNSLSMTVEEIIDFGDRVMAIVRERATGMGSELAIDQHFAHVWTIRDGRVITFWAFTERTEALEA